MSMITRRAGIPLATAQEQLQRIPEPGTVRARPLPLGVPGRATPKSLGIVEGSPLELFVIGDSGGIKTPLPQAAVCAAMAENPMHPSLIWHVGDLVYFGAEPDQWAPQFYEPLAHVPYPVIGCPGNHDDEYGGDPPFDLSRPTLDTWMANMAAREPGLPPCDSHNEFARDTMNQPYCDWTLQADAVTVVALWSNVPSGGHLYPNQIAWLTQELMAAPTDRPLIVSLHHPPYSIDAHHGGSRRMGDALDAVFVQANRFPDVVLAGHVHDYQRFTRSHFAGTITYIVIGNSGYHNLHKLAPGTAEGEFVDDAQTVTFNAGDDEEYGFLKLTVDGLAIAGEYVGVSADAHGNPTVSAGKDNFHLTGAGARTPDYKAKG